MSTKKAPSKILYTIKDKNFPEGEIQVLKSANAWWTDRQKLNEMIAGRKMGMTWTEINLLCGISEGQRKYFFTVHKELFDRFTALADYNKLLVRQNIHKKLESGDKDMTRWYAERKISEEFKEKKEVGLKPILIDDVL